LTLIRNPYCASWVDGHGQWNGVLSGLLVFLTTVLMLVMPITEHLSNWDRFLRGGTDVEFTLLAALLFAALVVLATDRQSYQQQGWRRPNLSSEASVASSAVSMAGMRARRCLAETAARPKGLRITDTPCLPGVLIPMRI
jgi:hypothetical protein